MKKPRNEIIRAMALLSQIGIMIVSCVIIGVLLGKYLDSLLNTSPWLLLVCSLLGMAAAFKGMFDLMNKK